MLRKVLRRKTWYWSFPFWYLFPMLGYANQMFSEDDLPADPVLVGADNEPIILDRLQVLLISVSR